MNKIGCTCVRASQSEAVPDVPLPAVQRHDHEDDDSVDDPALRSAKPLLTMMVDRPVRMRAPSSVLVKLPRMEPKVVPPTRTAANPENRYGSPIDCAQPELKLAMNIPAMPASAPEAANTIVHTPVVLMRVSFRGTGIDSRCEEAAAGGCAGEPQPQQHCSGRHNQDDGRNRQTERLAGDSCQRRRESVARQRSCHWSGTVCLP